MLSLPEDWSYTTGDLAKIYKEGVDSIGSALTELERAGDMVHPSQTRHFAYKGKINWAPHRKQADGIAGAKLHLYRI